MNDKNEQSQSQEVPPDPSPELDSFILGLTPEKLKDTSLEDKEREENFRFADQLHDSKTECSGMKCSLTSYTSRFRQ